MKKILSIVLSFAIVLTVAGVSFAGNLAIEAEALQKLTDTSDFALSSIELTENMLMGYNIGNNFESTELRSNYNRPSDITDFNYYKETHMGNIQITEDYIIYLKSLGIQAVRLPITWFNVLEDESGVIYPKSTWYAPIETRREAWYNGTISPEFLERIKQVVDWVITNDMYCVINTHHDAACNNANAVNPIKLDEANREQTYNYLTNIWGQVGNYFKDYGSKLLFEFYNEATDSSGSMTPSATRSGFTSELLEHLIELIRDQGSNNENRFLICPHYGGVSFWANIDFASADNADDKLIITTHSYQNSGSVKNAIQHARNKMNEFGIGAIIDEIGVLGTSVISDEAIAVAGNIRQYSDEYQVSCFWWDNGEGDFSITNRYYKQPSSPALGAYIGKDLPSATFTDVNDMVDAKQPNWVKLYTEDGNDLWGKKYLIICSENQITTLDEYVSGASQGYFTLSGVNDGLVSYYISDDDVTYTRTLTFIPSEWCKIAWDCFKAYGTSYYSTQVDGNYQIQKLGDGLQKYVETGDNLITQGGDWIQGQYSISNGDYEGEGTDSYNNRICLENKLNVQPNEYYMFKLHDTSETMYQYIIRGYDSNGDFSTSLGTITNGAMLIPDNISQISISLFASYGSDKAIDLLNYFADGTFQPSIYHFVSSDTNPDPTVPTQPPSYTTAPTQPTTEPTAPTQPIPIDSKKYYSNDYNVIYSENVKAWDGVKYSTSLFDPNGIKTEIDFKGIQGASGSIGVGEYYEMDLGTIAANEYNLTVGYITGANKCNFKVSYVLEDNVVTDIGSELNNTNAINSLGSFTLNETQNLKIRFTATSSNSYLFVHYIQLDALSVVEPTTSTSTTAPTTQSTITTTPTTQSTTQPTTATTTTTTTTTTTQSTTATTHATTQSTTATTHATTAAPIIYGDVNNDNAINSKDSLELRRHIAQWAVDINLIAADVNVDGNVNAKDTLLLKRYIENWDVQLGVKQ